MLKTNSKKARENIRSYILKNVDFSDCTLGKVAETDTEKLAVLFTIANSEVRDSEKESDFEVLKNWICGIQGIFDVSDFIYYEGAKKVLADLLEETPEEANRYGDIQSFNTLVYLISREITNAAY